MDQPKSLTYRLLQGDLAIPFYFALFKLLLHFSVNIFGGYGYFRDELYYIACSNHLDIGYVDQPPFSIFVLKISILLFGDSIFALRIIPAVAGALTVFLAGLITRQLGGKQYAQILACLCSLSLITLAMNGYYSMNSLDILCWSIVALLVTRLVITNEAVVWIWLGVAIGIGMLNKIGVGFLAAGFVVGIIATPHRKWLKTPWPYVAGLLAMILFSPYVFWNINHDFAHLEFIKNASEGKYSSLTPARFVIDQFLINNPLASIVWISGLLALIFLKSLKPFRILLFLYVVPLLIFMMNGTSKAEYLAPAYCVLWAAGGIVLETLTEKIKMKTTLRVALPSLIVLALVPFIPMVLPLLPVERFIPYSNALGLKPDSNENKELGELPQFYADMFGWEEKAIAVAEVYHSLPVDDQKRCAIFSYNYGRCGAIDFFAKPLGLPASIGTHNNYWIWGPRDATGEVLIVLGGEVDDLNERFESVEQKKIVYAKYSMPYENNTPVFVCRKLKRPLQKLWPSIKNYD
jgi:hypothetical protein